MEPEKYLEDRRKCSNHSDSRRKNSVMYCYCHKTGNSVRCNQFWRSEYGSNDRGETDKLTVYYAPENTTVDRTITWTSSNPNVATAEGDGTLTAHGEGVTIITATVAGKSASIRVVVYAKATIVESVTLDHQSMDLTVGDLAKLKATVKQSGGDVVSVNWSSSDPSIVQVDSFGNIKAIGEELLQLLHLHRIRAQAVL